jgi:cell division septal protein FtsQ
MQTVVSFKQFIRLLLVMMALVLSLLGTTLYVAQQQHMAQSQLRDLPALAGPVNSGGGG